MGFVLDMNQLTFLNGTINNDISQETIMKKVKEQLKGRIDKEKLKKDYITTKKKQIPTNYQTIVIIIFDRRDSKY